MEKEGQPAVMEVSIQGDEKDTKTHTHTLVHMRKYTEVLVTFAPRAESNSKSLA